MKQQAKPKLLFFMFLRAGLPSFVHLHLRQHVTCLSQFFDVSVIAEGCDYGRACEQYEPDVTLFHSGIYVGKRRMTNLSAHPKIPRLGLCDCDAYCETREVFVSDMARWGVETFFTLSVSLASYTPSFRDNLFVCPNSVDPSLYRNYGLPKVIPILFTGSRARHYPWRTGVNQILSERYPVLQCPHFGWFDHRASSGMLSGEPYARMLNAAVMAPTCGTIANEVVRKHFEIPACNTCLVTQRSAGLEAAGFRDRVNCVFAEESDVLETVGWLFENEEELERITRAGHALVHAQHTIAARDQIYQWYLLNRQLKPGEKIVQKGPFSPLAIVERSSGTRNGQVESGGLDRLLLARGDERLLTGDYDAAEACYRQCLNYHPMPEPKLRMALCLLYKGQPQIALRALVDQMDSLRNGFGLIEPDPVEWAYLIVALLCAGKLRKAVRRSAWYRNMHHFELDRVRFVVRVLGGMERCRARGEYEQRISVHQMPERDMEAWLGELCKILRTCGQESMAETLEGEPRFVWAELAQTTKSAEQIGWKKSGWSLQRKGQLTLAAMPEVSEWLKAQRNAIAKIHAKLDLHIGRRVRSQLRGLREKWKSHAVNNQKHS